jgi:hypothetical protein
VCPVRPVVRPGHNINCPGLVRSVRHLEAEDVEIIFDLEKNLFNRVFSRAFKSFLLRFLCVRCLSLVKDRPPTVEEATERWFHDADLVLMCMDDDGLERHIEDKPMTY